MSKRNERIPFRVKMADGSIETIYAYSEKQAMFFASRLGKRPVKVVGILSEEVKEKQAPTIIKDEDLMKILNELEEVYNKGDYLKAVRLQIEVHKAISEGRISWSNELENKYKIFKYW